MAPDEALTVEIDDLLHQVSQSVKCTVKNVGERTGDAVVLGIMNSSDPQFPKQKLFDFARVRLSPGQETTVELRADLEDFSIVDDSGNRILRQAQYSLTVGDVVAPARATLSLVGAPATIERLGDALMGVHAEKDSAASRGQPQFELLCQHPAPRGVSAQRVPDSQIVWQRRSSCDPR
jgi:hypothetical protein